MKKKGIGYGDMHCEKKYSIEKKTCITMVSKRPEKKSVIEEHLKSDELQARMLQEACSIIRVLM